MPDFGKICLIAAAGISGFSLLLLIISVATPTWLDAGDGNTIGLFRTCTGPGCYNLNRVTQAGLSIFGLLLLVFAIAATIATLGLLYFSSIFVMSAYATWGTYTRDLDVYLFPYGSTLLGHTSVGSSYHLCVAAHYFLWTALTLLAFGAGFFVGAERNET
ncbi:hypothetical protein I4U23_020795 [Adineta vaga]|nr:hypothetical protein I4U23_020795 [Adineta vaga]